MRLKEKVALVTGGGSGIGRATAVLFAEEGARVVVADLDGATARETVARIRSSGGEATEVVGDVANAPDAGRMVKSAVDTFGKLDVLVNSAGVSSRNAVGPDASHEELWDRIMDVNLKGTYLVAWHAVPEMKRAGGGSIVNIASIIGLVGLPVEMRGGFNPYAPSKGGVVQFTRTLAVELAKDRIRVNCVCPGFVWSAMTERLKEDPRTLKALEQRHLMERFGTPEEVAYAVLYLASDESSYVTGVPLVVDGGYTAV